MCLPYSVPAMGPYSTGFPVARQPGLHSPPNDVSCLRRPTLPGSTLLPQVRRGRRHRRSHRVGAYSQLPTLDADARYHVGLLQLAGGDPSAALAQADTIQRAIPTHLFIYVLRAHAYRERGDARQEARAYADFLRNEPAEMTRNRPEYADHSDALTSFKAEASRVTGARSGT